VIKRNSARNSLVCLLLLVVFCACSKKIDELIQCEPVLLPLSVVSARPTALVEVEEAPVWTEFKENSITKLDTPENAALKPFTAWPSVEYAAGIVEWSGGLAVAVNRAGFLMIQKRGAMLELYFLTGAEFAPYTMGGTFIFQGKPVFFIYRNDFFGTGGTPPPISRFFTVKDDKSGMETIDIPVFSEFSGADGWDIEELFDGGDAWYFKAVLKDGSGGVVRYRKAARLSDTGGEDISQGVYMEAAKFAAQKNYGVGDDARDFAENPALSPDALLLGNLPPLPDNFVYTFHGKIDGVRVTAWEERENWNTGAAGLLFTRTPPPQD
jgi:hypothetical protein